MASRSKIVQYHEKEKKKMATDGNVTAIKPRNNPNLRSAILASAKEALDWLIKTDTLGGRQGIVLGTFNVGYGDWLIDPVIVGEVPLEVKVERYNRFCNENAFRLYVNHMKLGHRSSAQSQDEKRYQFSGAILADTDRSFSLVLSVSGLEYGIQDEFIALFVAVKEELLSLEDAREIAKISGNNLFLNFPWVA